MGKMIVTKTKIAKEPYLMKESGHLLYSYEELCYYISSRMSLWVMEKERVGMTQWLFTCGVTIEDVDLLSPDEAAEKIITAGSYFYGTEKRQILDRINKFPEFPLSYVEKDRGDYYLSYGKIKKAYFSYEKAISSMTGEEREEWRNSLYHNMGIVCCRFFYWEEAKKWLLKAQEIMGKQETKNALSLVEDMLKKEWELGESPILTIELEKKKQEFLNEL